MQAPQPAEKPQGHKAPGSRKLGSRDPQGAGGGLLVIMAHLRMYLKLLNRSRVPLNPNLAVFNLVPTTHMHLIPCAVDLRPSSQGAFVCVCVLNAAKKNKLRIIIAAWKCTWKDFVGRYSMFKFQWFIFNPSKLLHTYLCTH